MEKRAVASQPKYRRGLECQLETKRRSSTRPPLMHEALDSRLITGAVLNKVALQGDRVLTVLHMLAKDKERKVGPKTQALIQRFLEFEARIMSCGFTPACHRPKLICW